jgi:hypothetical protein
MKLIFVLGLVSLFMLPGCAARGVGGFRTVISPNCLTAPVVMKDCSASGNSTRCREVELRYRPGCAQIQVKKGDQAPAK